MASGFISILSILATLLPVILKAFFDRRAAGVDARKVLSNRDIKRLRTDLDKLRSGETPPPVP